MREIGHFIGGKAVKGAPAASATFSTPIQARSRPRSRSPNSPRLSMPLPMRRGRSPAGPRRIRSAARASCSSFSS